MSMDVHIGKAGEGLKRETEEIRWIPLGAFSREPGPCCMSYAFSVEELSRSMERVGVVNPPLVLESGGGDWTIVTGYRRIEAARCLGWPAIGCRVRKPGERSGLDWLLFNLYDNLATRDFNPVEKGMALERLSGYLSPEEVASGFAPLLGVPPRETAVSFHISLSRDLEPAMRASVAEGLLSVPAAGVLMEKAPEERLGLHNLLIHLMLSLNNQLQLIDLVDDITKIEGVALGVLLEDATLRGILDEPSLNGPQRSKAFLAALKNRRYPRISSAERAFRRTIGRLRLPAGVSLQPPPHFEGSAMRLEITFHSGAELREKLHTLEGSEALAGLKLPSILNPS